MIHHYILNGHEVVPVEDLMVWAEWFSNAGEDRIVKKQKVGQYEVSTVFLGLDHSFGDGPPLLFETMVFGDIDEEYQTLCSTWEEAEAQHERAVAWVIEEELSETFFWQYRLTE